jgi:Glycoside Hydrolase Family 113
MKRSRLPILAILPITVITLVAALPVAIGTYPLRWQSGSLLPRLVTHQAAARPSLSPAPTTAAPGAAQTVRVARPWRPGMPQWGVQLYWADDSRQSIASITRQAWIQAKYLIGLKANSVAISFPFYTGTITSDKIVARSTTPSPQRLGAVLEVFAQAGLRTTVRPLMDERSLGGLPNWRGSIRPADRDAWFASYRTFLLPYLDVAQRYHVTTFTIATELSSMEGDYRWQSLLDTAAKHFSGEIGYDANWDQYIADPITMPTENLGVDAYFPVNAPDTASVHTLVDGWNAWLDKKATGPLPQIVLSESGIAAMDGAYAAPGDFSTRRRVNSEVQANWYTAVCSVVQQRHMSGVYWWSVPFARNPFAAPDSTDSRLDFAGRPQTEAVIRTCFSSSYSGPDTAPKPALHKADRPGPQAASHHGGAWHHPRVPDTGKWR